MVGWALRFDADVVNRAVNIELAQKNKESAVRTVETSLQWQVWHDDEETWEHLHMNDFICGNEGLFLLIKRRDVTEPFDFDRICGTIKGIAPHDPFYATALDFCREQAPYFIA